MPKTLQKSRIPNTTQAEMIYYLLVYISLKTAAGPYPHFPLFINNKGAFLRSIHSESISERLRLKPAGLVDRIFSATADFFEADFFLKYLG